MGSKPGNGSKWTQSEDDELNQLVSHFISSPSHQQQHDQVISSHVWAEIAKQTSNNRSAKQVEFC